MARRLAGKTQDEVGAAVGVDGAEVSEWERGRRKPNAHTLGELARLYGVSADWLLGLVDEPAPAPGVAHLRPVRLSEVRAVGQQEAALLIEALEAAAHHLRQRYGLTG